MENLNPQEEDDIISTAPKQGYGSDPNDGYINKVISTANNPSRISFEEPATNDYPNAQEAVSAPLPPYAPHPSSSPGNPFSGAYTPPQTGLTPYTPVYPSPAANTYPNYNNYTTSALPKNNILGIISLILVIIFPLAGLIMGIISTKKAMVNETSFGLSITSVVLNALVVGVHCFLIGLFMIAIFSYN